MTTRVQDEPAEVAPPRQGWLRRKLIGPLQAQLTQGVSPERLALTLAVGTGCSLFPFLGTTSLLNLGVGVLLRMNQPVLQLWNQLLGPIHLALILVYVRIGERLLGAGAEQRFSIGEMVRAFGELSFMDFLARFGRAGGYAFVGWLVTLPFVIGAAYLVARPLLMGLAKAAARVRREP